MATDHNFKVKKGLDVLDGDINLKGTGNLDVYLGTAGSTEAAYISRYNNDFYLMNKDSGDLIFGTNNENKGRFTSTGNFQIGTTTVIDSNRVLQNVTANANIITSGQFNDARISDVAATKLTGTINNNRLSSSVLITDGGTYSTSFTADLDTITGFRIHRVTGFSGTDHRAFTSHHNLLQLPNTSSSGPYEAQLAFTTVASGTPEFKFRSSAVTWSDWVKVFNDGYHPNADTWTTPRTLTVTLTGDVTGTANTSIDGSANKTITISTTGGGASTDTLDDVTDRGATTTNGISTGAITATSNYSGGSGDYTDVSTPPLKIANTSGYLRIPHISTHESISIVYNYETGKDVYFGEPNDTGHYYFRGRDVRLDSSNLKMGANTVIDGSRNITAGTITAAGTVNITNSSSDSTLLLAHGAGNSYDALIQFSGSAGNMATEGAELWYDNNVGDFHIATTYNDPAASIRFHTRTAASKSTSNERFVISGNGDFDFKGGDFSNVGNIGAASGHVSGKFAVKSTSVHASYDLYNNGTTYLNGAAIIDDALSITGGNSKLNLAGGAYEGSIVFGSNDTWHCGIRQHDDADAEMRIWHKHANGMIFLATGYDGEPASISRPTDGLVVQGNKVGIGNFSSVDPGEKLHVKSTSDAQLRLDGDGTTWAGIHFVDSGGSDYIWFHGATDTWSFGGGGSSSNSEKRIHAHGGVSIGSGLQNTTVPTNGLLVEGPISAKDGSSRTKFGLYGTDTTYAIGMQSAITFGGLNDWAMTFQFNNESDRGFWWGDSVHDQSQGAMALTTDGLLTVANRIRVGYGESDTTAPATYALDIDSSGTNSVQIGGTGTKKLFSYHDSDGAGWATGTGSSWDNLIYWNHPNDMIRIYTGQAERLRVQSSGMDLRSGSFFINGTNVIDASRNLNNIAEIRNTPTLSGVLKVDENVGNIIYEGDSNMGYIPYVTQFRLDGAQTGAIKVELPDVVDDDDDMISFWIDIYDYTTEETISVYVGGYNYRSNTVANYWYNCTAMVFAKKVDRKFTVRFGYDAGRKYVAIGETNSTWDYPCVVVRSVQVSFRADVDEYYNDWDVDMATTLNGVDEVISDTYPYAAHLASSSTINFYPNNSTTSRMSLDTNYNLDIKNGDLYVQSNRAVKRGSTWMEYGDASGTTKLWLGNDNSIYNNANVYYFRNAGGTSNLLQMNSTTLYTAGSSLYLGGNNNSRFSSDDQGEFGFNYATTTGTSATTIAVYSGTTKNISLNRDGSSQFKKFMHIGRATSTGYATDDSNWVARLNVADSVHAKIEVSQEADSMRSHWYAHTGHSSIKFGTSSGHEVEFQRAGTTKLTLHSDRVISNDTLFQIGGTTSSNAYNAVSSTKLLFGGGNSDATGNYYIGTNMENYGGNYTKLDLRWHTGIRMGAQPGYGGIRMYNNEDLSTLLFSVGKSGTSTAVESGNFRVVSGDVQIGTTTVIDSSRNGTFERLRADGGNLIMGDEAYSQSSDYVGMKTSYMSGSNDYMIISGISDGSTYVSAKDGSSVRIRGGGNNSSNQLDVPDSSYITANTSNFYCTGNVTAYYSSDKSLKTNIRVIDSPIERIKKIRGVFFDWTDDYIKEQSGDGQIHVRKDDVGVIAQDVQPVLDEVVTTRDDGTLAVRYEKMVALCIEAIKEQQQKIEKLEELVEKLISEK